MLVHVCCIIVMQLLPGDILYASSFDNKKLLHHLRHVRKMPVAVRIRRRGKAPATDAAWG